MKTATITGNIKTKEFHKPSCFTIKRMPEANKIALNSLKHAIDHGFDPCGHCLGTKDEIVKRLDKKYKRIESSPVYYFGYFYGIFNGFSTNEYSGIEVNIDDTIELFATLHQCAFENGAWNFSPVQNHKINIACDDINFPSQQTNADGAAKWSYTIPQGFEPGDTSLRANFNISANLMMSTGNLLFFNVPVGISNIRISPNPFDQKTNIYFKLSYDKRIKADIYRNTNFQNPWSHVKNIRNFNDGILKANDDVCLEWDGKIDHGFREGESVVQGNYVVKIEGEFGESDTEYKEELIKKQGILGGTDPEPNQPTVYVSDIRFSPNPFTIITKVTLNFFLLEDAKVSIHIQHINWKFKGDCVKEIINHISLKKGTHSYTWDGTNNKGNRVVLGEYKVRILANDIPFVKGGLHKKWK